MGVVMVVLALAPSAAAAPPEHAPDGTSDVTALFVEEETDEEVDLEDEVEIGEPLTVENPVTPAVEPAAEPPVETPDAAVLGVEFERAPELPRTGAGTVGVTAAGLLALLLGMHLTAWSRRLAPAPAIARR